MQAFLFEHNVIFGILFSVLAVVSLGLFSTTGDSRGNGPQPNGCGPLLFFFFIWMSVTTFWRIP